MAQPGQEADSDSKPTSSDAQVRDIATLISMHQAMVWRYLRSLGAELELADDLTQETFLEIIRKPLEQISDAATGSYLRRVAHNLFISRRRREGRVVVTEHVEHLETAWTKWAGFDGGERALEALADCFAKLTERARMALRLRFVQDASRQVIADALGVGEHGAKNLMQRAKSALKECVEQKLAQIESTSSS